MLNCHDVILYLLYNVFIEVTLIEILTIEILLIVKSFFND